MTPPIVIACGVGAAAGCALLAGASVRERRSQPRGPTVIATASIAAGFLTMMMIWRFDGAVFPTLTFASLTVIGAAAAAVDVIEQRLPTVLLAPGFLLIIGPLVVEAIDTGDPQTLIRAASGGVVSFAFHLGVALACRGGLGAGDVKLAGLVGLALAEVGWSTLLLGVLFAWLAAAVVVLLRPCRVGWEATVVMGPFLLAGFQAAVLGGG